MAQVEQDIQEFDISMLPELETFITWPRGVWDVEGVSLKSYSNEETGKSSVGLTVKLDAVVEYMPANLPLEEVPAVGSTTRFSWQTDSEAGLKFMRKDLTAFGKLTNGNMSSSAIAAAIVGAKFRIVSSIRLGEQSVEAKAAGEEVRKYSGIKNIIIF